MAIFGRSFPVHPWIGKPLPAAIYNVSVTEAATATDAPSAVATYPGTITEAASAADAPSAIGTYSASLSEAGTATDAPSAVGTYPATLTEAGTATDANSGTGTYPSSMSEAATATDADSVQADFVATVSETGTADDTEDAILISGARYNLTGGWKPYNIYTRLLSSLDRKHEPDEPLYEFEYPPFVIDDKTQAEIEAMIFDALAKAGDEAAQRRYAEYLAELARDDEEMLLLL